MGTWSAYVINLARAPERWRHVSSQLAAASIPFQRIEAIDGKALSLPVAGFSPRSYALLHGRYANLFEVACYQSHLAAMAAFLASGDEHALILEDDVTVSADLAAIVGAARGHAGSWDILRLSTVNRGRWFPVIDIGGGASLGVAMTREKGAGGYMVNRRAAETFARRLVPMRLAYDIAFDLEYFYGLRALAVLPVPIRQKTGFKSQIQADVAKLPSWRYFTVFPYRAALESSRFVCRGALYAWLRLKNTRQRTAMRRLRASPRQ